MTMILPSEVAYSTIQGAIPNGTTSMDVNLAPSNGQSFSCSTGAIITFDLPAKDGFIVPNTLNLRYKYSVPSTLESKIRCTPVYAPFQRIETIISGTIAEIIPDYNVVQNMLTNCNFDIAQKYGNPSYGWRVDNDGVPNMEALDSRHCELNEVGCMSAPLPCILSSCQKYIPMGAMGSGTRINLTLETLNNIFCPAAAAVVADPANGVLASAAIGIPIDLVLSDLILSYQMVMFAPEATNEILGNGPIFLKTQSFNATTQTIPIGSAGSLELVYSQKMASMKSAFMHFSSNSINGKFDSFDILGTANGDLQFGVASKMIPPRPLSNAPGSKAMIMTTLKQATGSIYDKNNTFSINNGEFYKQLGTATSAVSPAKCYFGVNTEICPSNNVMLSGISTQDSPITCRMNLSSLTPATVSATLITAFDVILEIDPSTKSVVVRK
jgi:hypothetical protein